MEPIKQALLDKNKKLESNKKQEKETKKFTASAKSSDGRMAELVYDSLTQKTKFAVFDGQAVEYKNEFYSNVGKVYPFPGSNDLISKFIIHFPSEATEFGSELELIKNIQSFIHKYVDISPFFESISVYYVLFTWVYDRFNELPYLRFLGDYGSGKSRCLQAIGSICYKPMFAGGATTVSPIFRIIDGFRGTLILDEADYRFSDTTTEIVKILNSGYQRGIPVLRSEGKGTFEVKSYDVYGPKIIATRNRFHDLALESRFLVEEMEKKEVREGVPFNLPPDFYDEALVLRNQLLMWRFKNFNKIFLNTEVVDRSMEPRLNQIIAPLLSIIQNEDAKSELKIFIKKYNDELTQERGMSSEAEVFEVLLGCYASGNSEPVIKSITEKFNDGKPDKDQLTAKKIGGIIRQGLKLKSHRTNAGYIVSQVENEAKIIILRRKFGLPEEAVNLVNDVNVGGEPQKPRDDLTALADRIPF